GLTFDQREILKQNKIIVDPRYIKQLIGIGGNLKEIRFEDGSSLLADALFFASHQRQTCKIAHDLGCLMSRHGRIPTDKSQRTNVPGLFVAGDASKDMQFV